MSKVKYGYVFLFLVLSVLLGGQVAGAGGPTVEMACPDPPEDPDLPDVIERDEFCLYYDLGFSTVYEPGGTTSFGDALNIVEEVEAYWERYEDDFGFLPPSYGGTKLEIWLPGGSICTALAFYPAPIFPDDAKPILISNACQEDFFQQMRIAVGHELFHRVQWAYNLDLDQGWLYEGSARAMEDQVFADIDNWANALNANFTFHEEVNNYLADTNADITSDPMEYRAALWWKYFMEQFGSTAGEPQLGVDAMVELWEAADDLDGIAAVNLALANLGAGTSFNTAFRQFAVANWTKELAMTPDDSYRYVDETQAENLGLSQLHYGPLLPTDGGVLNAGESVAWNAQIDPAGLPYREVSRYGVRYYQATPGASCTVMSATFDNLDGGPAFYHVVTQQGDTFAAHTESSGSDWTQSFLNDGFSQVTAIVGSLQDSAEVSVTFSCEEPVIAIELPNTGAPAYVGSFDSPDNLVVQVAVTNGSDTGPVVGGLTGADFSVEVNGIPSLILGGGFVQAQEEYFLLIDTPPQAANGPYDLEVFLEEPGTANVIASDLETDAVVYDHTNTDHVIVTDVSGSMGWDGKMAAAQHVANLFIDASNSSDGLGLVSFSSDVVDTLGIEFGTLPHRNAAHAQVNGYMPTLATSIGDGVHEAAGQYLASPTGNERCQFTLLSDGMENQPQYWADVMGDVVDTGCPVMTIAFGSASNELLMQEIASDTGGIAYYNDVFVSSEADNSDVPDDTELELSDTYMHALCAGQGCERLASIRGTLGYSQTMTHRVIVDETVSELSVVLDWMPYTTIQEGSGGNDFEMWLRSPSGVVYEPDEYAFADNHSGHVAFQVAGPEPGEWEVKVASYFDAPDKPYQVLAFGQTPVAAHLVLPDTADAATGDYLPIYAIWRPAGQVVATVEAMDGTATVVPLYDDGQHGDGAAGDGLFAGLYTLVNQADDVQPVDEAGANTPPAADEGAYSVHLLAIDGDIHRETKGAFAVLEGQDSNGDGVPDDFIAEHCPGAPNSDADLDQLSCDDEYFAGTNPNQSDTDGGGENDGSEVLQFDSDPLNPADDQVAAPDFLQTTPQDGSVLVMYDARNEYTTMRLFRATDPAGPWLLRVNELPPGGVYEDEAANGTAYYYRFLGLDSQGHGSAIPTSSGATPSSDPVPPLAHVSINGNAPQTSSLDVVLSFTPYEGTPEEIAASFDDIVEMKISNDLSFAGATWQPFEQDVAWQLDTTTTGVASVYVRFRDAAGNESVGPAVGSILYQSNMVYLPVMLKP